MKAGAALLAAAFALAACSAGGKPAPQSPQIDGTVAALYRPYSLDTANAPATPEWDRPVFSAATGKLIGQWKESFSEDNVLPLQDFDWFCECQDWDPGTYKFAIEPHGEPTGSRIEVAVSLTTDKEGARRSRLELVRESGAWKIDDLYSHTFPHGLKAALQDDIRSSLENPV